MVSTTSRTKHDQLIGVRLGQADAARLRALAAADQRPPAQLARKLLSEALRGDPEGGKE